MTRFSANLGFLWTDRALPDAIYAAHAAGFSAVELHWPYATPAAAVRRALDVTGLPVLSLNTDRGDVAGGENGLAGLPGRQADARAAIDQALGYGAQIGARYVHVMAGNTADALASTVFVENLQYACDMAAERDMSVLIEALNRFDAPGYFLSTTEQAAMIITQAGRTNLKLMFDCYHVARTEGDVIALLRSLWPLIGHIQIAGVPDRGPPDQGVLDYARVFATLRDLGHSAPVGAEYRPGGATDDSLGWMPIFSTD